jgi:hypothetical protein
VAARTAILLPWCASGALGMNARAPCDRHATAKVATPALENAMPPVHRTQRVQHGRLGRPACLLCISMVILCICILGREPCGGLCEEEPLCSTRRSCVYAVAFPRDDPSIRYTLLNSTLKPRWVVAAVPVMPS